VSDIWVAMSGGVDSSVAAARLVQAGHRVTGVTMQLLPEGEEPGRCCSDDAVRSARRVCDLLGIEHYTLNMREPFEREVIEVFVAAYAAGLTPNPCIACNDRLKFSALLAKALTQGADALATGHYARIVADTDGRRWLERGLDRAKDQSYFLYRLTEPAIDHVLFPVGDATKEQVREEARRLALPSAVRPESQEVCFVPDDAGAFVCERLPQAAVPGPIVDGAGRVLGTHRGVAHYTIGQRRRLGLPGGPWFVSAIDAGVNTVVVSAGRPDQVEKVELTDVVWRSGTHVAVEAVIRYRAAPVPARARRTLEGVTVEFDHPVERVAPGQAVVCYTGDRVVGGGVVSSEA